MSSISVRGGPLNVVDDDDIERGSSWRELQAELLLQGLEDVGFLLSHGLIRVYAAQRIVPFQAKRRQNGAKRVSLN